MLSIQTHIVTMKLLGVSDTIAINNYLKTHTYDSNAWDAYFQLSPLNPEDSISNAFKVLPNDLIAECAFRFAESVLPIFEKERPTDNRPRACIEAGREYVRNPNPKTKDAAANAAAYATNAAYRRETQFKIIVDVVGRSAINRIGTQNASIQL